MGLQPGQVVRLSSEFKTSLQATAWRISRLLHYKIISCCWQYERACDMYQTVWTTPLVASRKSPVQRYFVDKGQPAYKKFSEGSGFRGWSWASLGGPVDRYFMDGLILQEKPRRLITVIVLEAAAEQILAPYLLGSKQSIQCELF